MNSATQPVHPEPSMQRLAAIVLAAGYSSRMVDFKPLLPLAGDTALERCAGLFRAAGIAEVIVVLGHRADTLRPLAERCGARCVVNPHFDRGMYSSVVAGCRALPEWAEAAFVLPADTPLVRPATIRQLAAAWTSRGAGIVYPAFHGRRGHPPLIAGSILAQAAQEPSSGPLSSLLAAHESDAVDLLVADEAIHMDMDTPADYSALVSFAQRQQIPTTAECWALLAGLHVEPSVIRHSRRVAEVAQRVASALSANGILLNLDLVRAGALLHDLAKGQPDHAAAGASILRSMEFPRVADVVAAHTDLEFSAAELDERAIVYLADKLVRGEDLVTIVQRFRPALQRFANDPPALQAAQRRMQVANNVARAVESRVGAPLSVVVGLDFEPLVHQPGAPVGNEAATV